MQKNFRLVAAIVVTTIVNYGTFAQTETHKDVLLDGKPAQLDLKTGEVKKLNKAFNDSKISEQDSTKLKTEIQANLITNTPQPKPSSTENVIVTSKPDTLAQHYKNVLRKEEKMKSNVASNKNDTTKVKSAVIDDVILITPNETKQVIVSSDAAAPVTYTIDKTYANNTTNFHIVQKGETLYSLSRLYNTTLGQLKQANSLETTLIMVGQKLKVRNFESAQTSGIWIVSKGDTLYSIAKKNNTTVASLKALNGLTGDLIFPGQELQL